MNRHTRKYFVFAIVPLLWSGYVFSGEIVSSMKVVPAYMDYQGYHIVPMETTTTHGDPGPTQMFEFKAPSLTGVTIGRLYTSCTCIKLSAPKKKYAGGEPIILSLRNVLPTDGQTYALYVQITRPIKTTIRYDTYVISDQFIAKEPPVELEENDRLNPDDPAS